MPFNKKNKEKNEASIYLSPNLDDERNHLKKEDSSNGNVKKSNSSRVDDKKSTNKSLANESWLENDVKMTDTTSSNTSDAETVILDSSDWQIKLNDQSLAFMNTTGQYHDSSDENSSASTVELERNTYTPQDKINNTSHHRVQSSNLKKLNSPNSIKILQKQNENASTSQLGSIVVKPISLSFLSSPSSSSNQLSKMQRSLQAKKSTVKEMGEKQDICLKRKLPDSITLVLQSERQSSIEQTKHVTEVLAKRGVQLMPGNMSQSPFTKQLNSEVSIIPSSNQHKVKPEVSKILTIDLTTETSSKKSSSKIRQKGIFADHFVCKVCDKTFSSAILLSNHMFCHRKNHNARLQTTCQNSRMDSYPDLAFPVINMSEPRVKSRLTALGINSVIPLSNLQSSSGCEMFALPICPVDTFSNPNICNIGDIGACNVMPLGKLNPLTFNNSN